MFSVVTLGKPEFSVYQFKSPSALNGLRNDVYCVPVKIIDLHTLAKPAILLFLVPQNNKEVLIKGDHTLKFIQYAMSDNMFLILTKLKVYIHMYTYELLSTIFL